MARVNEIRFVGYGVSNLETEKMFYIDTWKLTEISSDASMAYLAVPGSKEGFSVRLRQTDEPRIDVISWSAENRQAVDELRQQVEAAGGKIISEPHEMDDFGGGYGFRFFDPVGFVVEVCTEFATRIADKIEPGEPLPERISHVVLHAPDHKGYVEFYEKALGFRVSDWLGDFMCFLRCNEWHHRLAVLPGAPAFNHVAYDVPDVDSLMKSIARVKKSDRSILWGPGRHTAGNNVFSYFATPTGYIAEYTTDLERVDDDNWVATVHTPSKEIMDQWGVGVGGPETMPKSVPNSGLFSAPEA